MNGRLNIAALALAVALLAVGPLALTLARAPDYRSSAAITLDESNPSSAYLPGAESLVAKPLQVRDLQRQVAKRVDWFNSPNDLDESVSVRERRDPDGRAFVVTARGPSPKEAQELAQVTAVRLRDAAEAAARFTQPLQLQRIRKALSRTGATDAERDELLRRRTEIAKSVRTSQPIFDTTVGVATLSSQRIGDRVLGALPGSRPLRPDPVWAAVAGMALAGALALWVLVLSSPRPGGAAVGRAGNRLPDSS